MAASNSTKSVRYSMAPAEEAEFVELAWSVGETLNDDLKMLSGAGSSLAATLGRLVEQRVFAEEFGDHDAQMMHAEYRQWEEADFVTIVNCERPVAVTRSFLSPSIETPTKVEVDLGVVDGSLRLAAGVDRAGAIRESATLAAMPEVRQTLVLPWLMGESCYQFGALPHLAMVNVRVLDLLRRLGGGVAPIAGYGPQQYLGVLSQLSVIEAGSQPGIVTTGDYGFIGQAFAERAQRQRPEFTIDLADDLAKPVRS